MTKEQSNFIKNLIGSVLNNKISELDDKLYELDDNNIESNECNRFLNALYELDDALTENKYGMEVIPNRYNCEWNVFVGVHTPKGMKYVTGIEYHPHYTYWEDNKPAMDFYSETYARDIVCGLTLNGHKAFVIKIPSYIENVGNWTNEGDLT